MHQMNLLAVAACLTSLLVTAVDAFSPGGSTGILHRPLSSTVLEHEARAAVRVLPSYHSVKSGPTRAATRLGSYLDGLSEASSLQFDIAAAAPTHTAQDPPLASLNLATADALADGVIASATRNQFPPIVVTVLDRRGNALVQKRMDGDVHVAFPEFSYAKAYTAVALGVSSRAFRDKYTSDGDAAKIAQLTSMMAITGTMAAFPGGIALRNGAGEVVGAIGVSGAAGDEDEYCALRAVWDSGLELTTEPKEHSCVTALE